MPKLRLTKSIIDGLPVPSKELVYWDEGLPGFGLKVTPMGRKVFVVLYRAGGGRLRKYTIGPYGRVTLHNARIEAQKVLAARLEGRDPASEKLDTRRRVAADRMTDVIALFIKHHVSKRRSAAELTRILQRELVERWGSRSVHDISKRDVIDLITAAIDRGAPVGANKTLKVTKSLFSWCVGRAIIDRSPCDGVKAPTKEISRDRVLTDAELARVITAARHIPGPYGGIVEMLALTAQRREEVARMTWDEIDLVRRVWTLAGSRTKNGKPHVVQLSNESLSVLASRLLVGSYVFSNDSSSPFQNFSLAKRQLDAISGVAGWRLHDLRRTAVSGMARLGAAPHVADRILNHSSGTISGVAAVYQRHEFMEERREALELWGRHVEGLLPMQRQFFEDGKENALGSRFWVATDRLPVREIPGG